DGRYLGILAIGINPNPTVVISSNLTRDVTLAVFVSIWVMVILGAVFNALTITQPIKELSQGVRNIAEGNFKQRIDLPFGGELGELIISFNDMAERLERYEAQNIEELTAEKAKLETLVSTIADGAVLLDAQLKVILVNPTAQRLFNWEDQDLSGASVMEHLPSSIFQEIAQPLQQVALGRLDRGEFRCSLAEPHNRTLRILINTVALHKAQSLEPLCQTCQYHRDDSCTVEERPNVKECSLYQQDKIQKPTEAHRDVLKGIAMTVQDITREAELNEAKSQFISNVSHELRTPLFNIKSFIETLHDYGEDLTEEQRREFLETANSETDRLTRLVNDVLDLSRLESCRIYHFEAMDIFLPIEQTLRTYKLNARDKGIELNYEIQPDLPAVLGHYDLLLQVFANLVGNSLKFTTTGGRIMIRAYALDSDPIHAEGHALSGEIHLSEIHLSDSGSISSSELGLNLARAQLVRIEVSDTGSGIALEDQAAIFTRFFRVENRVHTLEGTGLGLSIVRNIVERHHSQVHLVSELGVGTTFWFDLAVYQEPIERPGRFEVQLSDLESLHLTNG
ncbi:MAG: HAMP domain-containing protein, partial [Oscillatoriales cyanobacterium RM1_1_9]|nr:HAMP domain-containing protein [Oscillatoriales cyanobacterium RM1_1_9]